MNQQNVMYPHPEGSFPQQQKETNYQYAPPHRRIFLLGEIKAVGQTHNLYTIGFPLYKILENANKYLVSESRSVAAWGLRWGREGLQGISGSLGVMNMSSTLIVMMVSQVHIRVKTHHTVPLNMCTPLYVNYTSI